jgi:UDP-N-acetylmuramoyl-L-alanyl-D-glutamate--2,6-diaminopimelate ligase
VRARTLGALLERLGQAGPPGVDPQAVVTGVEYDSRRVVPGALFVAMRGQVTDGNRFAETARRKGALAVISEQEAPRPDVPWVRVSDARASLARLAAAFQGDPAASLALTGVTGTNGKTTTTHLIDAILRASGRQVGLLGTVQYRVGARVAEAARTTPESADLHALLREMKDAGCAEAVLEVSSHALTLERLHGVEFEVAVFTNLTRDHLDFHGDMNAYFAAKRGLFDTLLRPGGRAVVNADDDRAAELLRVSRAPAWTFGLRRPADFKAGEPALSLAGTRFAVETPFGALTVETPLLGRFNVQNVLAALCAALARGASPEQALQGVAALRGVPGRLERVDNDAGFSVVVDYAHTDDALKNLLETVRELGPRRIVTVFGCGGDRDRSKRPLMGMVAARLSDVVVVTSDNPRSEPPEAIIEEVLRGTGGVRRGECHAVVDRREAIARAFELAGPGDAVVIAGKGHETTQTLRERSVPFDDRQVARDLLGRAALPGGRA